MFNIKEIKNVVQQIVETRQLSEESLWTAIESAFAAAYKKEYAKNEQIIRARINRDSGETSFFQVKQVLDDTQVLPDDEDPKEEDETRVRFNPERHMMIEDARLIRDGVKSEEEILFPLEVKTDFGRIAAQSARQVVTQKIHEAERQAAISEFEGKEHTLVHGQVQCIERGNVFVDLGRTVAILPFAEQIRNERFKQGDTIRAYIQSIDTTRRSGGFVRLSRACREFVIKLFEMEVPELTDGILEIKAIARDPGVRTKIAVKTNEPSVDPVGSFVGQRGVRVMTVKSELGGEQIDIINWSDSISEFIAEALLPAEVMQVTTDTEKKEALVQATDEQIPISIGRGGQNIRLASQMTGWAIAIMDSQNRKVAWANPDGEVHIERREEPEVPTGDIAEESDVETGTDGEESAGQTPEPAVKEEPDSENIQ